MRSRRRRMLVALAPLAMLAILMGCGSPKKMLAPNLPPETELTVHSVSGGNLAPVNHVVRLHWFGNDPDGDVVAYDIRLYDSTQPPPANWTRLDCAAGNCTDSLFTIPSASGTASFRLEVRAVDNKGEVDPTPAGQTFNFFNSEARVQITGGPATTDSTYGSATISWNVDDPGGDLARMSFRVYLDGNAAQYDSVYSGASTATYTVPSAQFIQGGWWKTGPRTIFVQAVDDGGRISAPVSRTWWVRSPNNFLPNRRDSLPADQKGRVLLIDNAFRTSANNVRVDTLFSNTLDRNLPTRNYSILRLEFNPGSINSARDLAQVMRQFDSVIWYRGYDTNNSFTAPVLGAFQDSVGAYLDHGGRFMVEGLNLTDGTQNSSYPSPPLRADFAMRYLGNPTPAMYFDPGIGDSSVAWGNRTNTDVVPTDFRSSTLQDSTRLIGFLPLASVRAFLPTDTTQVALWAKPGSLEPGNPNQAAVALSVRQPSGGRAIFVGYTLREGSNSSRVLAKLIFHATNGLLAP